MTVDLVEAWKRGDPFLLDVEGFTEFIDRRMKAEELKRLIRLGHPNQHGEAYTRFEVIKQISQTGLQILEDLGWPSDMNSNYKYLGGYKVEKLGQILAFCRSDNPIESNLFHLLESCEPTNQEETVYPDITEEDIQYAIEQAVGHIADDYIPRTTLAILGQEGRERAIKWLRKQCSSFGSGCRGKPSVTGSPKGIIVHWGYRTLAPSHVYKEKRISFSKVLNHIVETRLSTVL